MTVQDYVDKYQKHLPAFLRDFHDQKDVFKAIQWWRNKGHTTKQNIDWMAGHIYVIDTFLRFMAYHGYTLQKSRATVEGFGNLHHVVDAMQEEELDSLKHYIHSIKKDVATTIHT